MLMRFSKTLLFFWISVWIVSQVMLVHLNTYGSVRNILLLISSVGFLSCLRLLGRLSLCRIHCLVDGVFWLESPAGEYEQYVCQEVIMVNVAVTVFVANERPFIIARDMLKRSEYQLLCYYLSRVRLGVSQKKTLFN